MKKKMQTEEEFQQAVNESTFKYKPTTLDIEFLKKLSVEEAMSYDYSSVSPEMRKAFKHYLVFETKRPVPRDL